MIKVYIPAICSLSQVETMIHQIEASGVEIGEVVIEDSFGEFMAHLDAQDTAMVYSLDCFASMIDLLSAAGSVVIRSVKEPWFSEPVQNTRRYLAKLHDLSVAIHAARTNRGLRKARQNGKILGRQPLDERERGLDMTKIEQVEKICADQGLSVSGACRAVGLSRHTYYRRRAEVKKS